MRECAMQGPTLVAKDGSKPLRMVALEQPHLDHRAAFSTGKGKLMAARSSEISRLQPRNRGVVEGREQH